MKRAGLAGVVVGQRLLVLADQNEMGGGTLVVTKVGRTLVHCGDRRFQISDGMEPGKGIGGYCYAMTAERHAEYMERVRLLEQLRPYRDWHGFDRCTTDQLRRVVAILSEG